MEPSCQGFRRLRCTLGAGAAGASSHGEGSGPPAQGAALGAEHPGGGCWKGDSREQKGFRAVPAARGVTPMLPTGVPTGRGWPPYNTPALFPLGGL